LEEKVRNRTRDLEEAQYEILDRLSVAAEYRDDATGEHAKRVGFLSERVALALAAHVAASKASKLDIHQCHQLVEGGLIAVAPVDK
jgi:response regulator RpfG family c-di-GMP phosphodiesterase